MQNFKGKYCICHQGEELEPGCSSDDEPLQAKEFRSVDDCASTMLQCLLCEDWFHASCIGPVPAEDAFLDYFCAACAGRSNFLQTFCFQISHESSAPKQPMCFGRAAGHKKELPSKSGIFSHAAWKEAVCGCEACHRLIDSDPIRILLLQEAKNWEPIEEFGQACEASQWQDLGSQLDRLDRVSVINGIDACNKFKDSLKAYLRPFADSKTIVTKEVFPLLSPNCLGYR